MRAFLALVLAVGLAQDAGPSVALSDVDAVKALYASAAYEEALQRLDRVPPADATPQLEQLRALSLLALGRTADAEAAFERLVRLDPLYVLSEADVSPRVAEMFADVRQRTLPAAARALYVKGKSAFDQAQYGEATRQLQALLTVLADPALASQTAVVDDLKQLAEGFLRLAELERQAAARAAAPPPSPSPAPPPAAARAPAEAAAGAPTTVTKIVIYSAADSGVTPPVEVERRMPPWAPPPVMARSAEFRGVLDIVVDELGSVESAVMTRPTVATYDVVLLDATRRWRFVPAQRNGEPVKYRLSYSVVLEPRR